MRRIPILLLTILLACSVENESVDDLRDYSSIIDAFDGSIDPANLFDYEGLQAPDYITKDNTTSNPITNEGATLGRVLFYDKNLSVDNLVSCASCHQQANAFSDLKTLSEGVAGETGRHSMRLINTRFADEGHFFWDERAASLEIQTTQPIQDHIEMGFSGENGDPSIADLDAKLAGIDYYRDLFYLAFGSEEITEVRMQLALAQFIRSIQSFYSKFDVGLAQANNINTDFTNFTNEENLGKQLFLDPPPNGGAGCGGCHRGPEFDIDPNSDNNGVITQANSTETDLTNTRAGTLRDIFKSNGELNGPLMHDGSFSTLEEVIEHYNQLPESAQNANLDRRLEGPGGLQRLNLTEMEKSAIVAFIKTLSGTDVYTAEQWSDPF